MNFGQMVTAALTASGVGYDTAATKDVVNVALQTLSSEERWPWLQGAVWTFVAASAGPFTPPFAFTDIRTVTVNDTHYPHVHIDDVDDFHAAFGWCVENEQLVISPDLGVGETVVVRADRTEAALVADADVPVLPVQFHHAIVTLAAAMICERVDLGGNSRRRAFPSARASALRNDYMAWVHRMRRQKRRGHGPIAAYVRPGAAI